MRMRWVGFSIVIILLVLFTPLFSDIKHALFPIQRVSYTSAELFSQFQIKTVSPDGTRRIAVANSTVVLISDLPGAAPVPKKVVFSNAEKLDIEGTYWLNDNSILVLATRKKLEPKTPARTYDLYNLYTDYLAVPVSGGAPRLLAEALYSGPAIAFNAGRTSLIARVNEVDFVSGTKLHVAKYLFVNIASGESHYAYAVSGDQLLGFSGDSVSTLSYDIGTKTHSVLFSNISDTPDGVKQISAVAGVDQEVSGIDRVAAPPFLKGGQAVVLGTTIERGTCYSPSGLDFYVTDISTHQTQKIHTELDEPIYAKEHGFGGGCAYSLDSILGVGKDGSGVSKVLLVDTYNMGSEYLIADLVTGKASHITTSMDVSLLDPLMAAARAQP